MQEIKCRECDATLDVDTEQGVAHCPSCGKKYRITPPADSAESPPAKKAKTIKIKKPPKRGTKAGNLAETKAAPPAPAPKRANMGLHLTRLRGSSHFKPLRVTALATFILFLLASTIGHSLCSTRYLRAGAWMPGLALIGSWLVSILAACALYFAARALADIGDIALETRQRQPDPAD